MSYHVTILRTSGSRSEPITRTEVEALARARGGLSLEEGEDGTLLITLAGAGHDGSVLVWQDGEIWTANPSETTLASMIGLAEAIGARVRGDELETYRSVEETYLHPDDAVVAAEADAEVKKMVRRTQRMRWLLPLLIFGSSALLGLVLGRWRR